MELYNQNKQLTARVRQLDATNFFRRMDYLFMVLQYKDCFDGDFVGDCAEEIRTALCNRENDTEKDEKGGE